MTKPTQRHFYLLGNYCGVFVGTDEQWSAHAEKTGAVEGLAPVLSIEQVRSAALSRMIEHINSFAAQFTAGYAEDEVRSWPTKASEAKAVINGGAAGPILTAEAETLGIPILDLAKAVDKNAQKNGGIIGKVSAIRGVTAAAIRAAETPEAVQAALLQGLASAKQAADDEGLVFD